MTRISDILHTIGDLLVYDAESPLLFSSGLFWVMFMLFLPLFAALRRDRWQMMVVVVLFSLFFYYKSSGAFVAMLFTTSVLDWMLSRSIAASTVKWQRLLSLILSLSFSLGMLGYFKYANFFIDNWNMMVQSNFQPLDLVVPVGISFYTFQSVSYIVDVYRRKVQPTDTWLEYAFFLTFFPALVAGPIVRADYFLPQIHDREHPTRTEMYTGLWLVLLGVLKKALIADYIAQYNDLVFDNPGNYTGFETLMGVVGYVMQIYCDFSGYSDMAIGLALIMGFRLNKNFNFPYKARNISDFWDRWHISLSTWMRDYIFIPLGGSRCGTFRACVNSLVTMLFAGLWHGAAWRFIAWGGIHGVALAVYRVYVRCTERWPDNAIVRALYTLLDIKVLSWTLNMLFIAITFVFFRAETVHDSWVMIHTVFSDFSVSSIVPFVKARVEWIIMLGMIITAHALPTRWWDSAADRFVRSRWLTKLIIFMVAIQLILQWRSVDVMPFIYFDF